MTRGGILNGVMWTLVLICIGAGVLATISFFRLKEEVQTLRSDAAALQANKAITLIALTDLQSMIRQPVETPVQTCAAVTRLRNQLGSMTSDERERLPTGTFTILANVCTTAPGTDGHSVQEATRAFVLAYVDALNARLAGQFGAAERLYTAALNGPDAGKVDVEWRLRAMEGVAYAQMRQHRVSEARASLAALEAERQRSNQQRGSDYLFVFSGLTGLKNMCLSREDVSRVRTALAQLRGDFDRYTQTRPDDYHKYWAALDRRLIERDAELFNVCSYAGVKPISLPPLPSAPPLAPAF